MRIEGEDEIVMPGLVPGIHVLAAHEKEDVDGQDKPGHDETARDYFNTSQTVW